MCCRYAPALGHDPETSLSQHQGNRKRRGRSSRSGGRNGNRAADHQARVVDGMEDPQTFWARSNARLGVEAIGPNAMTRQKRAPMESPCAMCGVLCQMERFPKHRLDVRCDACRAAVGSLLGSDEERQLANQIKRQRRSEMSNKYDGLPAMSEEDLAAVAEMRSRQSLGNGRSSNRRRRDSGGGGRKKQPRRRGERQGSGGGGSSSGNGGGGRGRNADRQDRQQRPRQQPEAQTDGDGRRRRRRRRRPNRSGSEGGGGGNAGAKSDG